jgi:hypothetical protein
MFKLVAMDQKIHSPGRRLRCMAHMTDAFIQACIRYEPNGLKCSMLIVPEAIFPHQQIWRSHQYSGDLLKGWVWASRDLRRLQGHRHAGIGEDGNSRRKSPDRRRWGFGFAVLVGLYLTRLPFPAFLCFEYPLDCLAANAPVSAAKQIMSSMNSEADSGCKCDALAS